jgi:acyl-CoA-binding protein
MNFEEAAERVKQLSYKPSDSDLLALYGLYKQAIAGDVNISRPSFWDMVGKTKWDSWKSFEGISIENAKQQYIDLVTRLLSTT